MTSHPREIVLGDDNKTPTVKSPWQGPYNIVNNHCHNAAAQNSSADTGNGFVGCASQSATTKTMGHTINWGPDPSRPGVAGAYCAYEPQSDGGTPETHSVCCWQGSTGAGGVPLLASSSARRCITSLCAGQANFNGSSPPRAYPAGLKPPVQNDCSATTGSLAACKSCCSGQASGVGRLFPQSDFRQQISSFRVGCAAGCADKYSNACLGNAVNARNNATNARNECRAGQPSQPSQPNQPAEPSEPSAPSE